MEEARLVEGLRRGETRAFDHLVHHHQHAMLRVARAHATSHAGAADAVQEAWLGVVVGIGRFEGRSSLASWLLAIVRNQAIAQGRRERRLGASLSWDDDEHGSARSLPRPSLTPEEM